MPKDTAILTFSGLYNGINPWTNFAVVHRPIPSTYQPLLAPEPRTHPVDGGDLNITITWDKACVSNHGFNQRVEDHTGDNYGIHHEFGGGVLFGTSRYSMSFSKPVEVPSFWWTYYLPCAFGDKPGTISAYQRQDDAVPLKTVELNYSDPTGYVWREITNFSGMAISKIVFNPGAKDNGLNIDDVVVRAKLN